MVVASRAFDCIEGGAWAFVKPTTGWGNTTQTAKLTGSDWGPCGGSGFDEVAVSGDVIVAGAGPTGQTAYVFVKPAGGWKDMTETARLTTDPNLFGIFSLGISGRTVAVGYTDGSWQWPRGIGGIRRAGRRLERYDPDRHPVGF